MGDITVRVKFCGNCNPRYDAMALLHRIASKVAIRFVFWDDKCDFILNGCEVCCENPAPDLPHTTVVSGYRVKGKLVDKEMLESEIVKELLNR